MEPKIEEKDELRLVGLVTTGKTVKDINIPKAWEKFTQIEEQIKDKTGTEIGYEVHIIDEDSKIPIHFCFVGIEFKKMIIFPLNCLPKQYLVENMLFLLTHSKTEDLVKLLKRPING